MEKITKEQIEKERQERVQNCSQQIAAVLEEFSCTLIAKSALTDDGRIVAQVVIVDKV